MAAQDISAKANNEYINQLLKEQEGLNPQHSHAYKLLQQGMSVFTLFILYTSLLVMYV